MRIIAFGLSAMILFAGCDKNSGGDEPEPEPEPTSQRAMGWNKEAEDLSKYPREISFKFGSSQSSANLPAAVDLSDKLPPVGNQGNYGTCIAWSVGYGMRTYMNAVSKNLTKQQLADKNNQFSPADLWMAMAAAKKNTECDGADFEPAFDVLVSRGITTLNTAPYSNINCDGAPSQNWTSDAEKYKIQSYRMIDQVDMTVENLKTHLSQGRAISFGAQLGDNFMAWNGAGVLNSDTYLNPGMDHAYHAILLVGYDDSKGNNGAFRVFNSWDTDWGDEGYIWVDYKFFLEKFVFIAFVATPETNIDPNDNNEIDPNNLNQGADLAAYHAFDMPSQVQGGNRQVYFNVYNSGTTPINSSNRWNVVYMYYNAYNANDYGILTHFYYTDEVNGVITFSQAGLQPPVGGAGYCINQNIPSGKNIAAVYFNQPDYEYFIVPYYLPQITGYYYMVVIADAFNSISERDKQNNFFFITDERGYPYYFQNGQPYGGYGSATPGTKASNEPLTKIGGAAETPVHTPVTNENRNAYTPEEIRNMIINHRKSGELQRLTKSFIDNQVPMPKGK